MWEVSYKQSAQDGYLKPIRRLFGTCHLINLLLLIKAKMYFMRYGNYHPYWCTFAPPFGVLLLRY